MRRFRNSGRRQVRPAGLGARALALSLALTTVFAVRPARGEPGDIFTLGAPVIGSPPPKAAPIADGDASVSTQTGALQYSYPISVPPGRNGMQPHLSLAYSSQAPIYGGLAAGWTLSGIPTITEDTSKGTLYKQVNGKRYASSLAGGRPLVLVGEAAATGAVAYRAQNDATFARYQRLLNDDASWKVYTTDGNVLTFGQRSHAVNCSTFSDGNAPLTEESDAFGNLVDYLYTSGVDGECLISSISWGKNDGADVSNHFATVAFNYGGTPAACSAGYPGATTSYRTGVKIVTGASRLGTITLTAYPPGSPTTPEYTRVVTLGYDTAAESCTAAHAPFRALSSIQETATGTNASSVQLPAVTFSYGNASLGTQPLAYSGSAPTALPWSSAVQAPRSSVNYNLGWGYRFTNDVWPTVEAMSIDVDGDGLVDRLVNASVDANGHVTTCQAHWYRNRGPAFTTFEDKGLIPLPTLKWGSPGSFAGGGYAQQHSPDERCALNFQYTAYTNSDDVGGILGCPGTNTCPAPNYYCNDPNQPGYGNDCWDKSYNDNAYETYLAYRWIDFDGDGRVDLVASPTQGGLTFYNLQQGSRLGAPREPALFGSWPTCPDPGQYTAYPNDPGKPYTMCGGMFPWFVYLNGGNGVFGAPQTSGPPLPTKIVYQPIPLETTNGDSSILSSPTGQFQGWVDIDGDGLGDAVVADATGQSASWKVFRNDGTGQLLPAAPYVPFSFGARVGANLTATDCVNYGSCNPVETQGLLDVNADGLADEWVSTAQGAAGNVALNFGDRFDVEFGAGTIDAYPRPGTDGLSNVTSSGVRSTKLGNVPMVYTGTRTDSQRLLDVDLDGRTDVIAPGSSSPSTPNVHFNQGVGFGGEAGTLVDGFGVGHLIVANSGVTVQDYMRPGDTAYTWELRSDLLDLDGDGIPEGLNFSNQPIANQLYLARVAAQASQQPPRLLIGIDNHRGTTTSVTYGSMASASVIQEPRLGKAMPRTQWVVSAITSTDSFAGTHSTTSYLYKDPRWGADDEGRYAFRGFEEVTATGPSGAQTISDYSYSPDWSGRLVSTLVAPAAVETTTSGEVRSIDDTTWEPRTLFGGAITTYHATAKDHWTCDNGQTAQACRSNTSGRTRTIRTLSALTSVTSNSPTVCANNIGDPNFPAFAWEETSSRLQGAAAAADGDRVTDSCYVLTADQQSYRLLSQLTTRSSQVSGSLVTFAKTSHSFDPSNTVAVTDEVWVDGTDANRAITRRVYDMTTGNVLQRRKPKQEASSGPYLTYTYDARKLFPAMEVDELGMELDYVYEYGTGTKLETKGPNVASCSLANPPNCPTGSLTKQDQRIVIDGIGRTTERWEAFSDDGSVYTPYKVETFAYQDGADPNFPPPASVTHQHAIGVSGGVVTYAQDQTLFDGHGRPTKITNYVFGSAPADQITTYSYGNDGTLRTVTVPDPSANSTATVTYTYGYDSLGRPTSLRRPDTSMVVDQSGVDISYDGLTTTTKEVLKSGDGNAAITNTIKDGFGRLVEVREHLTAGQFITWASTTYVYDAADRVMSVTDPEGLVTSLHYDFANHRTQIIRPSGTWSFTYDKNGNVSSETTPHSCATGDPCDARYVTTFAYDDLDRVTSKYLAHRELSTSDLTLFAADRETYLWDSAVGANGGNYKGQLTNVQSFGPNTQTSRVWLILQHDAQGHDWGTTETFAAAGYNAIGQRKVIEYYSVSGAIRQIAYGDYVGNGGINTSATYNYDARGLPRSISLVRVNQGTQTLAVQTRNVAGLVTNRKTTVTGTPTSPITYIESNWTYDPLGRVGSQVVQTAPGPVRVAEQDLTYFGNDDPKTLDQYLANSHKQFAYGYDLRHQLTSANETTAAGYFSGVYSYGNAGRFVTASEQSPSPGPGSEVKPRNVTYQYGGSDPEQVTALTDTVNGTAYASYTYDAGGNQTSRCYGAATSPCAGESTEYVYDGEDQLRRATKKQNGVTVSSEEYWYDGRGGRLATVKRDSSGSKTELVWFLRDTEAHYDAAGVKQHVYSYINLGTPVARTDRDSSGTAKLEFVFHGLANNTLAAVDRDTGTVDASFSYAPFGEIVEATDGGNASGAGIAAHRRRMNDKYVDEVSDLAYYGARYYDKILMTWTQGDPLFRFVPDAAWAEPRRACLYSFDGNNPLRYLDPDGRIWLAFWEEVTKPAPTISASNGKATVTPQAQDAAGHVTAVVLDKVSSYYASQYAATTLGEILDSEPSTPTPPFDDSLGGGGELGGDNTGTSPPADGNGGVGGDNGTPGNGGGELDPPDEHYVVRGGEGDLKPPGEIQSGATGPTKEDAAQGIPHGKMRTTTAGAIRKEGGTVTRKPEPTRSGKINEKHVDICLGNGPCPFGPIEPNPVPKKDRAQ